MKKAILWVFGLIVAALIGFSAYSGAFKKVQFSEKEMGPYQLVYVEHTGAYKEVGLFMDQVYNRLLDDGIETKKGFGIYYDDPGEVKEDQLRSEVGCIVEPEDLDRLATVAQKYLIQTFEEQKCLVAEFPYRNQLSILLGISKVYPALDEYINTQQLPAREVMEVYDRSSNRIYYIMPLEEKGAPEAS